MDHSFKLSATTSCCTWGKKGVNMKRFFHGLSFTVFVLSATALLLTTLLTAGRDVAADSVTVLAPVPISATTGEKPQSKVWFHADTWWAVLPSTTVSPPGTWLWRLEPDNSWTNVLLLSSNSATKADTKAVED